MAIVKFVNGKNEKIAGLIKAIDYIADENKTEVFSFSGVDEKDIPEGQAGKEILLVEKLISEDKVDRAINYITKDGKTSQRLITGINCSPDSAFDEMMFTKSMYNKTGGRQFIHFIHSYSDKETNLTPELAHEISLKLLEEERFKGFEVLVATHIDKEHLHTHFILNAVNSETGRKWQQSNMELEQLKRKSNNLCYQYGLEYSFANTRTDKFMNKENFSSGEYRARKKGKSWKYEAWLAINECKKISTSKEEFIENLEKLNYKAIWVEERKNITFTLPNGRKLNNDKLHPPEKFTKEALLKQFQINKEFQEKTKEFNTKVKSENLQELYFRTAKFLFENPEEGDKDYPMTYLEGQALKEKMIEEAKGRGLDFKDEQER